MFWFTQTQYAFPAKNKKIKKNKQLKWKHKTRQVRETENGITALMIVLLYPETNQATILHYIQNQPLHPLPPHHHQTKVGMGSRLMTFP